MSIGLDENKTKMIAIIPIKSVINLAASRSLSLFLVYIPSGMRISFMIADDVLFKNESIVDIITAVIAAIANPFKPVGITIFITCGKAKSGRKSRSKARATKPIYPIIKKNGADKIPLQKVAICVPLVVFPIINRWT